jgi:hypothetical protein
MCVIRDDFGHPRCSAGVTIHSFAPTNSLGILQQSDNSSTVMKNCEFAKNSASNTMMEIENGHALFDGVKFTQNNGPQELLYDDDDDVAYKQAAKHYFHSAQQPKFPVDKGTIGGPGPHLSSPASEMPANVQSYLLTSDDAWLLATIQVRCTYGAVPQSHTCAPFFNLHLFLRRTCL